MCNTYQAQKATKAVLKQHLEAKVKAAAKDKPFTVTAVSPSITTSTSADSINGESVRRRDIFWEDMFAQLKAFKEANGHCMVPQKHPHLGLPF